MVSWLNIRLIGFLLFVVIIVQAEPLLETSNDIHGDKTQISNQQLYELYKIMRTDPRFVSVSNNDIVLYIYRNFVLGIGNDIDFVKPILKKNRRHRYQNPVKAE